MTFGNFHTWDITEEETGVEVLEKCYDKGLRTPDMADVYSNGKSEILFGKFIKKYNIPRERIVILTKFFALWTITILISACSNMELKITLRLTTLTPKDCLGNISLMLLNILLRIWGLILTYYRYRD